MPPPYPPVYGYPYPYPPPAYAYPPVPMAYPVFGEPGRETLKALSRLRHATLFAIAASGVMATVGTLAVVRYMDPSAVTGALVGPPEFGLKVAAWLLQLCAAVLGWSAFEEIADNAREINQEHELSAKRGVQFMYYSAAAWCIGGLAGLAVSGAYLFNAVGLGPGAQTLNIAYLAFVASFALTGLAVNILLAFGMQFLLAKVMREAGRERKGLFLGLALGNTIASVTVALYCAAVLRSFDLAPLLSVASAASLFVFMLQIRDAEEGARVLAVTRGNDPDAPMPAPPIGQGFPG